MAASIRTRIVKIGNSQGIQIPRLLLEQSGLEREVEVELKGDQLVIRSARKPRSGWEEAFAQMARLGDDSLLDEGAAIPTQWERDEWQW